MPKVNFDSSATDSALIEQCADRAATQLHVDRLSTAMDLAAANNAAPLDLARLLEFPLFDFAHDVLGIARHLNRTTGKLEDCFEPRCAKAAAHG